MSTNALTRAEMVAHLGITFQPSPEDECPPEKAVAQAIMAALPEDHYVMYDPEAGDLILPGLHGLGGPVVAQFADLENSMGYGDVTLLSTRAGPGLLVSCGGSSGQSACSFWVVPAGLEGWISDE